MFNLDDFLAKLTSNPGVYRMLNEEGEVLYVGKAANLKKRVSSYFNNQSKTVKTQSLVSQIAAIEVSITSTEIEALLLESNLIKHWRPKYNVLLRDDKSYPYIHVNSRHPFPRMEMIRSKKKPTSGDFFGPYPNALAVKETLNTIQKLFKIRNCRDNYFNSRTRPCLQYQIKRCSAPCTAYISEEAYLQSLADAKQFLQGNAQVILTRLIEQMDKAVSELLFEEAALLRDQIKSLRLTQEQQGITKMKGDVDVIVINANRAFACVCLVTVRNGDILSHETFFPSVPSLEEDDGLWIQVWLAFIRFYYFDHPNQIPPCIIVDRALEDKNLLIEALSQLRGKRVDIQTHPRGAKKRWLDFALTNLKQSVEAKQLSELTQKARFFELENLLKLDIPIERMECFDISHTQGEATVASCVVFDRTGPVKRLYRQFNISGITPGDDFAAMEQALLRRFSALKKTQDFPSLLIIDGGLGQVNIAKKVMEMLDIVDVPILGIAKGVERKAGWERLIWGKTAHEMTLSTDSKALHLLQHIRDEAHRFAITSHRKKRDKVRNTSGLESIEGVGALRRQALLKQFGGFRELEKAPVEEIAKVTGISRALAERVYRYFHPTD